ncbi:2Fe-2S iron-sulfur cluster-binding protein [Mycobacterium malmoense]|uniref:2Fe-2S iron-sulfur cluster-binding protein n=1 Tax=Mycobacterium malmoense TaxID=1780 RepID=UPI0009F73AAA|nr:2Fe-2S iron-sulfur cluster binding domain-containing protein [Mycobacterium malmoense]
MADVEEQGAALCTDVEVATVDVELDGALHRLQWRRDQTLVDTMLDAGINVPHSCREGHCGSCVATLISGEVNMAGGDVLGPEDRADGLILGCQARPVTDNIHIEF